MAGAIVHEWISVTGGSENVLEVMSGVYPDAKVYCLWNDSTGRIEPSRIEETWLARTPLRRSKAAALPLMPLAWRAVRNPEIEWALISSHCFAHHVDFGRPDLPRFVYVHSPARYVWNPELDLRGQQRPVRWASRGLQKVDRRRAQQGAMFAANSECVRDRVRTAWNVDARVITPPVEVSAIQSTEWTAQLNEDEQKILGSLPEVFVLGASRFIPYKRLDLVIRSGEAVGLPVVLAGAGPEATRLRALAEVATVPVTFVDSPSNALLRALYQRAEVFIFPAVEDFGIMPVEAMAAGTAVVAQSRGGTAETVVPGVSGAVSDFEDTTAIRRAVQAAREVPADSVRAHAQQYSRERFEEEIKQWVTP
ncbi:glycosyltransferase [Branchiibius sp. NY16-3462-2]|uniref:glycosyltransferase n=1 Tax=Branchiibius sp. NY16-3462-2 TaxID=1807500 RepID=UPI00079A7335|nr:glycosyltransferase [Branchiibius sp. NY16-3462-2]KYH44974.1 hypothetical protein AZH51_13835 [Branchiibius sp. NY16-3462-2]